MGVFNRKHKLLFVLRIGPYEGSVSIIDRFWTAAVLKAREHDSAV